MAQLPQRLLEGYQSFKQGRFKSEKERYEQLAEAGQKPKILLVGCVDSRATPESIFDAGPGEILVVRNVANQIPPATEEKNARASREPHGTAAAVEFAVQALQVEHIVVLGHGRCGGVKAYLDKERQPLSEGDHISGWVNQLAPADNSAGYAKLNRPDLDSGGLLERTSIIKSMENLMTFSCVKEAIANGNLTLHGAWFDIADGELEYYDSDQGTFVKA